MAFSSSTTSTSSPRSEINVNSIIENALHTVNHPQPVPKDDTNSVIVNLPDLDANPFGKPMQSSLVNVPFSNPPPPIPSINTFTLRGSFLPALSPQPDALKLKIQSFNTSSNSIVHTVNPSTNPSLPSNVPSDLPLTSLDPAISTISNGTISTISTIGTVGNCGSSISKEDDHDSSIHPIACTETIPILPLLEGDRNRTTTPGARNPNPAPIPLVSNSKNGDLAKESGLAIDTKSGSIHHSNDAITEMEDTSDSDSNSKSTSKYINTKSIKSRASTKSKSTSKSSSKSTWENSHSFVADCHICGLRVEEYESYCNHLKEEHYDITEDLEWLTCDVCGKMNAHKSNFISHLASHTGNKPFKCRIKLRSGEYCTTEASTRQNLQTHILKVHKMSVKHKSTQPPKRSSIKVETKRNPKRKKKKKTKKRKYDDIDIHFDINDPLYGYSYQPRRSKRRRNKEQSNITEMTKEEQIEAPYPHSLEILIAATLFVQEIEDKATGSTTPLKAAEISRIATNWDKILDSPTLTVLKNVANEVDDISTTTQIM